MGNYSNWPNTTSPYLSNVNLHEDGTMYFLPFGKSDLWEKNVAQQACLVLEQNSISFPT
jgi:hypothetical protein